MENVTIRLSEEFEQYNKAMSKYNVYGSTLDRLNEMIESGTHKLFLSEKRYEKQGRKGFPRKPTSENVSEIKARNYACYISTIGGFSDKVTQDYTFLGYIPTELKSVSWGIGDVKVIRSFRLEKVE